MLLRIVVVCLLGWELAAVQAKGQAFEVVSIRQNVAGGKTASFGPTPDGFRMVNMSLGRVILAAYPLTDGSALYWEPKGFPDWVNRDRWDIEARVSDADRAAWQDASQQPKLMQAMLRQMLETRCGLVVHRELQSADVFYLEVAKGGPKLHAAPMDKTPPKSGITPIPGGGTAASDGEEMRFYDAPMALLASMLTNRNLGARPVLDRTGLTGRYDFVVAWGRWTGGVGAAQDASDPGPTLESSVKPLGLRLVAAKG